MSRHLAVIAALALCVFVIPTSPAAGSGSAGVTWHHVTFHLRAGVRPAGSGRVQFWARMNDGRRAVSGATVRFRLSNGRKFAGGQTNLSGEAHVAVASPVRRGIAALTYRGRHYQVALGRVASASGDPTITVEPSQPAPSGPSGSQTALAPSIISTNTALPGDAVTVIGPGFAANELVDIYLDTPDTRLGTSLADGSGNLSFVGGPIPSGAVPAQHTIIAAGESSHTAGLVILQIYTGWSGFHGDVVSASRSGRAPASGTRTQADERSMSPDRMAAGRFVKFGAQLSPCVSSPSWILASSPRTSALLTECGGAEVLLDPNAGLGSTWTSYLNPCTLPATGLVASPLVLNLDGLDQLFVGTDDHKVYANSPGACSSLNGFPFTTGGRVRASPIPSLDGNDVIFASEDGKLYEVCVTSSCGTIGATELGFPVTVSAAPIDATPVQSILPASFTIATYVASTDGKLHAYDPGGASLAGFTTVTTGGPIFSSPSVSGPSLYVGSDDGKLYSVNVATGHVNWSATTAGAIRSTPAVANGVVFITSRDNHMYAFNAGSGTPVWSASLPVAADAAGLPGGNPPSPFSSSPAVVDGAVYVGGTDGGLYAFYTSNGGLVPGFPKMTLGPIVSSPAIGQNSILIGSDDGGTWQLLPAPHGWGDSTP